MIECLVLGDSIAVGTHSVRPKCDVYAQVGINSRDFNRKYKIDFAAKTVIISLGSNDHEHIKTINELINLRNRVQADKVYWILPANNLDIQQAVENVAEMFQDWTIRIPYLSKDGVHPTAKGYKRIGEITDDKVF
jgi:mannitol/fructose-specific phosphotransferase system IIA component